MLRKIIHIDQEKCNGCGLCVTACHEGAIGMQEGKAVLLREDYCDGLGDCLPACPTGAISFEEREAPAYDAAAVAAAQEEQAAVDTLPCGCPGSAAKSFARPTSPTAKSPPAQSQSQLTSWPVQIKLVPVKAPYFQGANLLIAADCAAYAYAGFHGRFMKNRVTLIGCPKLDEGDYSEKLAAIIAGNQIASVTVVRMEVPCCGGIQVAVEKALRESGKYLPWRLVVLSTEGKIIKET